MEVHNVLTDMEVLARATGYTLSLEQQAALGSSLALLQTNLKFASVRFVGKVLGVSGDYFVALGTAANVLDGEAKRAFISTDCASWVQLPKLEPEELPYIAAARGRFSGEPSWEFVVPVPAGATPPATLKGARSMEDGGGAGDASEYGDESSAYGDDEASEGGEGGSKVRRHKFVRVSEEKRLAYLVETLEFDVAVVPRGAYLKTATEVVTANPTFDGLPVPISTSLAMYCHFRPAVRLLTKSLLEREADDAHLDFMDTLDEDVPAGAWSVNYDVATQTVTLRSLLWPGAVAFHVAGTRKFGYAYFGTGEKNWNLPFMLPTKAAIDAAAAAAAEAAAAAAAAATGAGEVPEGEAAPGGEDDDGVDAYEYDDY